MDYKKYLYLIYSQKNKMTIGFFSSEKRLYKWANENNLEVYKDSYGRKIMFDNVYHQNSSENGKRYDLIPVRTPLDETCKELLQKYFAK